MATIFTQIIWFISALLMQLRPGGLKAAAAEIALLKQQLQVLCRNRQRAPNLTVYDRVAFALNSLLIHPLRLRRVAVALSPSTLLNFHRALVEQKYKILFGAKYQKRPGPKGPGTDLIALVIDLKSKNPSFGYGKIALHATRLLERKIDVTTVKRILQKHFRPTLGSGPSWLTLLGHSKDSLWSLVLFRCKSILLQSYWIMLVMDQYSRKIVGFSITRGNHAGRNCCHMFAKILSRNCCPKRLSTDHDPLFEFYRSQANLRVLGIDEIKSVPHVPCSHPFIERLIGTIRRENLDQIFFWNESDLERKLNEYVEYYDEHRIHYAFADGSVPNEVNLIKMRMNKLDGRCVNWKSHCRSLFTVLLAV